MVIGDAGRLRQVLINLIGNSIKFTESGEARVRVYSAPSVDGRARIGFQVIDTGIGIVPEAKQRLFAPFSQADTSITRRFGGTGLGLTITRHHVQLMGGAIELDSDVGVGTTVSFEIPFEVVEPRGAATQADVAALEVAALADRRVLIVDHREGVQRALLSRLQGTGAKIECASSDDIARAMIRSAFCSKASFDVIVVDRVRPHVDGVEFRKELSGDAELADIPVISIMSINWRPGAIGAASDPSGITLSKPVRRAELVAAITASIDRDTSVSRVVRGIEPARPADDAGFDHAGMRVLLAEDNPVNQEVAREFLAQFGCIVVTAENGLEAIERLESDEFDVVLMDCQMPELDGLSATRRIREIETTRGGGAIPIIAVTANAFDSDRQAAFAAGMDDYLSKPFSDTELGSMLAKWKGKRTENAAA